MTNIAIVDDRDPRIHYSGAWQDAQRAGNYNGTNKWTAEQGSSAIFSFTGTAVHVFGTTIPSVPGTSPGEMEFSIDGLHRGIFTQPPDATASAAVNQRLLFSAASLSDGAHTLNITATHVQAGEGPGIALDYITYDTGIELEAQSLYFIDDADTARITYNSQWDSGAGENTDMMNTSRRSTGAGAEMQFQFQGSGVMLFYSPDGSDALHPTQEAVFSIDGKPTSFHANTQFPLVGNMFFDSGPLNNGLHTLSVVAQNASEPVSVDFLLVRQSASSASESNDSEVHFGGVGISKTHIIIAVVGAAFLLLSAMVVYFCVRRRKRMNPNSQLSAKRASFICQCGIAC
ncbi:hypothetical protein C8F01DRAFT_1087864 [Mycena amicta]|nr:hypothetical protein C8F01DRAFT_1087864 [Mycena amicta]